VNGSGCEECLLAFARVRVGARAGWGKLRGDAAWGHTAYIGGVLARAIVGNVSPATGLGIKSREYYIHGAPGGASKWVLAHLNQGYCGSGK
jgi:hypothetical protein